MGSKLHGHRRSLAAGRRSATRARAAQSFAGMHASTRRTFRPPSSQFGFIKCSTTEGRYFFHVNDCDGQAAYGSTVR